MNDPTDPWQQLVQRARKAPADPAVTDFPAAWEPALLNRLREQPRAAENDWTWRAWQQLTTWTAGLAGASAVLVFLASHPESGTAQVDSRWSESSTWQEQIEVWVFEP